MPLITVLGVLGGILGTLMVLAFLFAPQLGVLGNWSFENFPSGLWAQIIAFGIILISGIWYVVARNAQKSKGINVDYAFKEIPPE
jgi:putative Mn2+ efflux pump MntP